MEYSKLLFGENDDVVNDDLKRTVARLIGVLSSERVYIEVGAHIGFVAVPVVARTKPKLSLLIEPHPASAVYLRLNLKSFVPAGVEWKIVEKMALDRTGRADFYYFDSTPHGSVYKRMGEAKKWEMDCVTIDSLIREYGVKEDVIMKIDAELAEPQVWKGMKESLPQIKFVVMEFMPNHLSHDMHIDPREFIREIEEDGYEVEGLKGALRENEIYQPSGGKVDLVLRRK